MKARWFSSFKSAVMFFLLLLFMAPIHMFAFGADNLDPDESSLSRAAVNESTATVEAVRDAGGLGAAAVGDQMGSFTSTSAASMGIDYDAARGAAGGLGAAAVGDLLGSFASPSAASLGIDYDAARGGVWVAGEGDGNIYLVEENAPHAVLSTINLVGIAVAGDGHTNGVCVLQNGNLLLSDYNGDLSAIDDYLFEIDPGTSALVNYWPLDGSWNTATDGTSINFVGGVEIGPNGHAYVTSVDDNNIYEIALVPGLPGTWSTVAVHAAPTVTNVFGIDRIDCSNYQGWLVSDWSSTTVAFVNDSFATNHSFAAAHDSNTFNTGVTAIDAHNPMQVWTVDYATDYIGLFESMVICDSTCSLINDGSFENGPPPASAWTEWSDSGAEWIMDPTSGWGIGAFDGTYAFWAGGYGYGLPNSNYVEQSISIPADAANLKFMTNFYRPEADDTATNDYFYVKINGASVFVKAMTQVNDTYPGWAEQSVDIASYAGSTVTLRFEGVSNEDGTNDIYRQRACGCHSDMPRRRRTGCGFWRQRPVEL